MKLYHKIVLGAAATLLMAGLQSCSEEKATLEGAKAIYIEMQTKDLVMSVGDTIYLKATVSNRNGDVINTPITWSSDNDEIALVKDIVTYKVKGSKSRAEGDDPEGTDPETGGDEGEDVDPNQPGDLDPEQPTEPEEPEMEEVHRWGVIAQQGAQNKQTLIRATLENGMYAVTTVAVQARDLSKAVTAQTTFKRSYARTMNDTVWFDVKPFQLVDESDIKFEMEVTEQITQDPSGEAKFANPRLFIDRELNRVGVVYTGPRIAGKGVCRLWLEDGELSSAVAEVPIHLYPLIWPGFEVDGKRPMYGPETPSNIKVTLMTSNMDINSTYNIGVCLGIDSGGDIDIENVIEAEKAGFMSWTVEGSAVVVENTFIDRDYESGFVSYITVRSGQRPGLSVIKYNMPDKVLTCNLNVADYNKAYPVDRIIVTQGEDKTEVSELNFELGLPANIEVSIEPEQSFEFHKPEITVADPSILEVQPIAEGAGYTRSFTLHKEGSTTITITSLDKSVTLPVTVTDRVDNIAWDNSNPREIFVGTTGTIKATVSMASGAAVTHDVNWTVSDPSVIALTPTGQIGVAEITGLKEGTARITAEYDGFTSQAFEVTVKPAEDWLVSNFADQDLFVGDAGDGTIYFSIGNNGDIYAAIPFITEGEIAGTFTGNDGYVELNGTPFEGCTYNLTITDNGDDTFTITGKITMPNGASVVFNGETFQLG